MKYSGRIQTYLIFLKYLGRVQKYFEKLKGLDELICYDITHVNKFTYFIAKSLGELNIYDLFE